MKDIVLTGGGTAGHVTPNLALIPYLQEKGYTVHYIGSVNGMEKDLVSQFPGVLYYAVRSGKLRRYFSIQNFMDPFLVAGGYFDSLKVLRKIRPAAIFSKGGFVTVPVVAAARARHIPTLLHESDYTPGLANKIGARFADKVLVTFEDTLKHVPAGKGLFTGTPIRRELLRGSAARGRELLGFDEGKPVLLCTGGSQGAAALNQALRDSLDMLQPVFNIVHLCGKGKLDPACANREYYVQIEYAHKDLPDIFACASVVLSRAGANSIFEFLALGLPALLVPLPLTQSRGDQLLNAAYFKKHGFADVLEQQDMTPHSLCEKLFSLQRERSGYAAAMKQAAHDGTAAVLQVIYETVEKR